MIKIVDLALLTLLVYNTQNFSESTSNVTQLVQSTFINSDTSINLEIEVNSHSSLSNKIISPANKDNKFDKAKFKVKAHKNDEWKLCVEGKDLNGNDREYNIYGKGTKEEDFYGRTNDAINFKDNRYFADGKLKIFIFSKIYGSKIARELYIDNTPPEIYISDVIIHKNLINVKGTVIDNFPKNNEFSKDTSLVSEVDTRTIPNNILVEKIIGNNMSKKFINYKVIFPFNMAEDFKDDLKGLKEVSKYAVLTALYKEIADKVGNIDECEYKKNYLILLQEIIENHQKVIMDQSDKISIESKKEKPSDTKIIGLENKIEARLPRLEILRKHLLDTAKKLTCHKDDQIE